MNNMPAIAKGIVVAHDPSGPGMTAMLLGQANLPGFPVKIGFNGAADALRIDQDPLPGIGTWGIIAFPSGDQRNGVWLCSILPSKMSAYNYNGTAIDPFMRYKAHWSGFWSLMDGSGNTALQWPEGSWFSFSSGATLPTVYRNVVQDNQVQQIAYTMSDRVSGTINPFQAAFHQAGSGLVVTLSPSGSVLVSGGTNSSFELLFGQTIASISSGGNVLVSGSSGDELQVAFGGIVAAVNSNGLSVSGSAYQIKANGYETHQGNGGSYTGHVFNIDWTGSAADLWIDVTNVGAIQIVSDYRIKKDVTDLPSMWDRVKGLHPISYTHTDYPPLFKGDDVERWGFIAHELQEKLIKSAATGTKDQENLIQSPNLFPIVAALTKALQEAMARIEALEGERHRGKMA